MPYIKNDARVDLADALESVSPETSGELNYCITKLILEYLEWHTKKNYDAWNNAIGVLECCKLEMYRRGVAPYEDKKIVENGDVYE